MRTMNWFGIMAAAITSVLALAGCQRGVPGADNALDWDNVKFNVSATIATTGADGAETRTAKEYWATGDRIVAFFEGNAARYAVLQYDGTNWTRSSLAATGAAASGSLKALHAGSGTTFAFDGTDFDGIAGDLLYTATGEAGSYTYNSDTNTVSITLVLTRPLTIIRVGGAESKEENAKWLLAGTGIEALNDGLIAASAFLTDPAGALAGLYAATDIAGLTATPDPTHTDGTEAVFMVWWEAGSDPVELKMYKQDAPETVYTRTYPASTFTVGKAAPIEGPASSDPAEAALWNQIAAVDVPVTGIDDVPTAGTAGKMLVLQHIEPYTHSGAKVVPDGATNKTIVWSLSDVGTTGVDGISTIYPTEYANGEIYVGVKTSVVPTAEGTLKVLATIANGKAPGVDYTEVFTIEIAPAAPDPDADILTEENFPDDNFRAALKTLATSTWGHTDGKLTAEEAPAVTEIDVSGEDIADLTGIEYFTGLTKFECYDTAITSLDLSANTALTYLDCSIDVLEELDVSKNTKLTELWCQLTALTSLDLSTNTALTTLYCGRNAQLTSLDVSNNTALTELYCYYNNALTSLTLPNSTVLTVLRCENCALEELDVSGCTALTELNCWNNKLTTLDVSNNTALTELSCGRNSLDELDVSNNTELTELYCGENQLTTLNVSALTALTNLWCYDNELTAIDISKNTALDWFQCYGNPGNSEAKFRVTVSATFNTASPPPNFTAAAWVYQLESGGGRRVEPEYIKPAAPGNDVGFGGENEVRW